MAVQTVKVSRILAGLMGDDNYRKWQYFGMVIDQLERLPEIIGADWLEEKVTVTGVLQAQLALYKAVLDSDFSSQPYAAHIRTMLCGMYTANMRLLDAHGDQYDMYEPNARNPLRLNRQAKQYYDGEILRYRDLLVLQPGVLMPNFDPARGPEYA